MHLCHFHGETMGLNDKKNELVEFRDTTTGVQR